MKKLFPLFALSTFLVLMQSKSAHAQACPNGDFENWNVTPFTQPDSMWYTSNPQSLLEADSLTVWSVAGFSGQAVHMESAVVGTDSLMAYITNGVGNPMQAQGGVPYSQEPTAITGYYRYNMVAGDSAVIFVLFKSAGAPVSISSFKISNATGSLSTFTAFSLPLSSFSGTPDSVIVAATCSNILTGGPIHPGSWLELDQLEFTTSQPIPGGSFNTWIPDSLFDPANWNVGNSGSNGSGVYRSERHYSGSYSVELVSQPSGGGGQAVSPAFMSTGTIPIGNGGSDNPTGGLPYTRTTDTLTGWYEYIPAGADSGAIQVNLYAAGASVGVNGGYFTAASSWTYFSLPFNASSTPDTMRIEVYSSIGNNTIPGSALYLDYMQLKSQPLPLLGVNTLTAGTNSVTAYPNPANDILNIRFNDPVTGPMSAKIYDMTGRVIDEANYDIPAPIVTFHVGYLPSGMYFYEVTNNGNTIRNKFVKE